MKALTYTAPGTFGLTEKPTPGIVEETDAIVRVTLASICMEVCRRLCPASP